MNFILQKVNNILEEREKMHGPSSKQLELIADFWSIYLKKNISQQDVCNLMVLFKLARAKTNKNIENYEDIIGYAVRGVECESK